MRKGFTQKPCHGCGQHPGMWGRPVDKVCEDCERLLAYAKQAQDEKAAATEKAKYRLPWRSYSLPYIAHCNRIGEGADDRFQKHMYQLVRLLAEIAEAGKSWRSETKIAIDGCKEHEDIGYLRPAVRDELNAAYQAAIDIADEAFENGRRDGRSLMLGLARGEVTIETFNKQATEKE